MISKKVLGMAMVGVTLMVAVGCSKQAAAPVPATPIETSKAPAVKPVADASVIAYDGDTYTLSYPKAWTYQLNPSFGNADTFTETGDNDLPILVVGKGTDGDRGMCLKSTKKETVTSASGLKFNLDYMIPDTAGDLCKDAFSSSKDQNFVQVNVSNDLKKDMYFTYAKADEVASVPQLKAVLNSVKKK